MERKRVVRESIHEAENPEVEVIPRARKGLQS